MNKKSTFEKLEELHHHVAELKKAIYKALPAWIKNIYEN